MRERGTPRTPFAVIGVAGGFLGLCCDLSVLFSLGVLGAVAGLSVSSWALIGLGLAMAILGWARWVRRRRSTTPMTSSAVDPQPELAHLTEQRPMQRGERRPPTTHPRTPDLTPDRSTGTTKGHHR